jgi:hypothetical protein
MFGRETRLPVRRYLEHGTSRSALARKLGVPSRHDSSLDSRCRARSLSGWRARALRAAARGVDQARRQQSHYRDETRRVPAVIRRALAGGDSCRRLKRSCTQLKAFVGQVRQPPPQSR